MERTHKLFSCLFSHGERVIDEAFSVCKHSEEDLPTMFYFKEACSQSLIQKHRVASHRGSKLGFPEFTGIMASGGKDIKLCSENMLQTFFKASVDFGEGGHKTECY